MRARAEYGRIVEGSRSLAAQHDLMFFTLTSRGSGLSLKDAENGYYGWTNRLLTALRTKAQRSGQFWAYAQVTERQKRGHPHSHILMTYKPHDLREGTVTKWSRDGVKRVRSLVPALRSDYLKERVQSAGLGEQYDISAVQSAEAASRYVAKYMFKPTMFDATWPKHWRRVRYSQSWPKSERVKGEAFVLLKRDDWRRLASLAVVITPKDEQSLLECQYMLRGSDVLLRSLAV